VRTNANANKLEEKFDKIFKEQEYRLKETIKIITKDFDYK
jgi:hypothetical protein